MMNNYTNIGKNILNLRKEKNVTQEQLAEYLSISTAAVSKWETGNSLPDIALIPQIAEYFEVSIDNLFDFKLHESVKKEYLDKIHTCNMERDLINGIEIAEKALLKYPNDFEINVQVARIKESYVYTLEDNTNAMFDVIESFKKAILLIPENNEVYWSHLLNNDIARCYGNICDYDSAIKYYQKTNYGFINNINIADLKIIQGGYFEAKIMTQNVLLQFLFGLPRLADNLVKCFKYESKLETAVDVYKFVSDILTQFADLEKPNYFNTYCVHNYMSLAKELKQFGRHNEMWKAIEHAIDYAQSFDNNPTFKSSDIKFFDMDVTFSKSHPENMQFIKNQLNTEFNEFKDDERYIKIIA